MGSRRTLFWFLNPLCLLLIGVSLTASYMVASYKYQELYLDRISSEARSFANQVGELWQDRLDEDFIDKLDHFVKRIGAAEDFRISIITSKGKVVAGSQEELPDPGDLLNKTEIQKALKGRLSKATRMDYVGKETYKYIAAPVIEKDSVLAVVRIAFPESQFSNGLKGLKKNMIIVAFFLAIFSTIACLFFEKWITEPVKDMTTAARHFASGDLLYRADGGSISELLTLATAINRMAESLREKINDITGQRNELETVLTGMIEAVLVLDQNQVIKKINLAGAKLFGVEPEQVEGKTVIEAIRNIDLHGFVNRTIESSTPIEEELRIIGDNDLSIQAHGSSLVDHDGAFKGIVVVLNDITNIKKLETIRQDFVANVSHELKTPITSIKGFLETLKDGALEDPDNAGRFLDIMGNQTDRLSMIIEDLLSLSRLEQEEKKNAFELSPRRVKDVMVSVIKAFQETASQKQMDFELIVDDEEIEAAINETLLEQALLNLIDNAIKYSEPGKKILLALDQTEDEVVISVKDQGCGISKEHVDRIFERFYRVDKARSRKVGGTGLGLAIVKHIVRAHKARMEVISSLGSGATFSIFLPKIGVKDSKEKRNHF